jgi:uncharacterized protein (TIGR02246 family)
MKRRSRLWLAPFLLVLSACAPASEPVREPADRRAEDEAAIRALRTAFLESQQAGDAQRSAAFYAEDAVIMLPGEASERGIEAIRAGLARFFNEYKWSAQEPIEQLQVLGDWAFTRTTWSASQTDKDTGVVAKLLGKAVHIYRRQPDGTWKIAIDIFNYDHPINRS